MLLKDGKYTVRRARGTAEFRGTVRYVAPAVHDRLEQGRRDDIWSVLYMLIELHCGLPWQHDRDKKLIEAKKLSVPDKVLLKNFPGRAESLSQGPSQGRVFSRNAPGPASPARSQLLPAARLRDDPRLLPEADEAPWRASDGPLRLGNT